MLLDWQGNTGPIQASSGGQPLTSHGPALVAAGSLLQLMCVGQSGAGNLWNVSTTSTSFPAWNSNNQIDSSAVVPGDPTPLSIYRPALAFFDGVIHMVSVGKNGSTLWWQWSTPGGQWNNAQLPWSSQDPQPALAVHSDGKLYLTWHQFIAPSPAQGVHNYVWYSSLDPRRALKVGSWAGEQLVIDGASNPAICSFGGSLYLAAKPASPLGGSLEILMLRFDGSSWSSSSSLSINGQDPLSSGGGAMAVLNGELYIVYPGQGGQNLWYAWIDAAGQPHGNLQIKISNHNVPKTSAPIGVAAFNCALCVACKGQSSNNIWVSYGTL